jgi:virulence-associated protein VagC
VPHRRPAPDPAERADAAPAPVTTRLFRSGNSTAIRLPKAFAEALGPDARVTLRRLPGGRLLIEPVRKRAWPPGFLAGLGGVSPDFADAVAAGRAGPPGADEEDRAATAFDDPPPAGS